MTARKDRGAALRAANRLTELGAHLSECYEPRVAPQVTLLDYSRLATPVLDVVDTVEQVFTG